MKQLASPKSEIENRRNSNVKDYTGQYGSVDSGKVVDANFRVLHEKMSNVEMSIPAAMLFVAIVFSLGCIVGLLLRNDAEAYTVFSLTGICVGLIIGWFLARWKQNQFNRIRKG